ncbi:MAG: phytanoyl-CoA dioxygenase family protein [Fuerstiella sp.]|nr:phytanoyl-CoA dioxygenase family protein [Fuerstiella sp.]
MSIAEADTDQFTAAEAESFKRDGFRICRDLIPGHYLSAIKSLADRDIAGELGDIEYEADVRYPGAPESLDAEGGRTIRRLRQAFSRDPVFCSLVKEPFLLQRLQQLLGNHIIMPLAHHNCIMTKSPQFSSDTGWHQDIRYWSFQNSNLVNVWIAVTEECPENGCLQLLPGTHSQPVDPRRLDEQQFLRVNHPDNQAWLAGAVTAELRPGDVLFFHARSFHSATRNTSSRTKYSTVFTFRELENHPVPGTRSASLPELLLS